MIENFDTRRVKVIKHGNLGKGPVLYWMSRDQRVSDNWSLLYSQKIALESKKKLVVVFFLVNRFLDATIRQYDFLIKGLKEIEKKLKEKNIPFAIITGNPKEKLPEFITKINAYMVITDFDPLKIKMEWKREIAKNISIPFHEVDSHNIVPCFVASTKKEFGAYTLRPKILRLLPEFLTEFPILKYHNLNTSNDFFNNNYEELYKSLEVDKKVTTLPIKPGEEEAYKRLKDFIDNRLKFYGKYRNYPQLDFQSGLSPYLHFGHISSQRIALEIKKSNALEKDKKAFLEELVIRKELADNFCYYDQNYDNHLSFPEWALDTLKKHNNDKRPYIYSLDEMEYAKTHDVYWNSAQKEMIITGKMHGYMRMYWAKKILEWTKSFEEAQKIAIYLNDKYELDGRDPNGYTGIAWSIGGVHDHPWKERPIFGKVRYMNSEGLKRKFNIDLYVKKIKDLESKE